jgi:hypothetical protein
MLGVTPGYHLVTELKLVICKHAGPALQMNMAHQTTMGVVAWHLLILHL